MVPNASVLTKSFSKAGNDTSIEAAFVEPDHKSRPLDEVLIGSWIEDLRLPYMQLLDKENAHNFVISGPKSLCCSPKNCFITTWIPALPVNFSLAAFLIDCSPARPMSCIIITTGQSGFAATKHDK